MIFLECIGSRASLSAEPPKTKGGQIRTNPVKSRFYGIFYFSSRTSERHKKAPFGQSTVTKSLLKMTIDFSNDF